MATTTAMWMLMGAGKGREEEQRTAGSPPSLYSTYRSSLDARRSTLCQLPSLSLPAQMSLCVSTSCNNDPPHTHPHTLTHSHTHTTASRTTAYLHPDPGGWLCCAVLRSAVCLPVS